MTRAGALIALEAIGDADERVMAAVERSDYVLTPALAECVEQLIRTSHASTPYYAHANAPRTGTRGDPRMSKYGWES